MDDRPLHVITGALGYTGKSVAAGLLAAHGADIHLRTLTNSPNRPNPFGDRLELAPMDFTDRAALVETLRGADVLYNTYWVRFNHKLFTFAQAVANTKALFEAAKEAGVKRIVHVSILKPDEGRGLAYYDGKLELEQHLRRLGVPHSVVRPGVLFGRGDILVNNIAWVLRHLPIFGVFGDGRYKLQPMHVDDMAALLIEQGQASSDETVDAVGPETFTYTELVRTIAGIIDMNRPIVRVPAWLGYGVSRTLNPFVKDVIITREEIAGLMRGLLFSDGDRVGATRLSEWALRHRAELGCRYASEVGRRIQRDVAYEMV
ncbi:MAG: NAD(P)H-binding protein [Phycisphaerales bacterium]|nr:NAD(P)H-binding protein [Phycisphaerales bacterium]